MTSAAALRLGLTVLLALGLSRPGTVRAQRSGFPLEQNVVEFERFSTEEGLSDYSINCIVQDRTGFMWFGAQNGLNRYDGLRFTPFKHSGSDTTSIADNWISALHEDARGRLWVGTRRGGLNRYDPDTEHFVRYPYDVPLPEREDPGWILAMATVPATPDTLWIGTQAGLLRLDVAAQRFARIVDTRLPGDGPGMVYALLVDAREPGRLWVGTENGLARFNTATETFTWHRPDPDDPDSLSAGWVLALHQDTTGALWIGTNGGGLNRFDPATGRFTAYRHDSTDPASLASDVVSAIEEDRQGRLWIGTGAEVISSDPNPRGIDIFDRKAGRFFHYRTDLSNPYSLSDDDVNAVYEDDAGVVWVATWGGLNKFAPARQKFTRYLYDPFATNGLTSKRVVALWASRVDTSLLWLGTFGGGLYKLDRDTGRFTRYQQEDTRAGSLSSNDIFSLYEAPDGRLWIATLGGGLDRFDPRTNTFSHFRHNLNDTTSLGSDRVHTVYKAPSEPDALWIATDGAGLNRLDLRTGTFTHFRHVSGDTTSLSDDQVWPLFEDAQGNLWVGTVAGGLNKLDRKTNTFTRYRHNPKDTTSLSHDFVTTIAEGPDGILWVGTFGGGLNRFDPTTETFTAYNEEDDLPFDNVNAIVIDDSGVLWVSTNNGLARFAPRSEAFRLFDTKDGLQGNTFQIGAGHRSPRGELFFGGENGFNIFYPERVQNNPHRPQTVITAFRVNDQRFDLGASGEQTIVLNYDQNSLSFEFAALDFTAPAKNRYRYRLEDHETAWFAAANNTFARYPRLRHETYTFRVQGANNDGVWGTETAMHIRINPPWWQTWWFYTLITLALLGLATAAYRYRVARLLEMEHMRIRIASDLHDDLGGKLSGIALMTDMVQRRAAFDETARRRLAQVSETARHMVDELRDIVWFITPDYDKLDDTLTKMQNVTEMLLGEIHYTFYHPENVKGDGLDMEFRRHFLLSYKEILHNVVRHAHAANVEIRLGLERGRLILTVADDGVGFDPETVSDGNGLKNVRLRAAEMNGTVEIDSRPGAGTTVKLTAKTT